MCERECVRESKRERFRYCCGAGVFTQTVEHVSDYTWTPARQRVHGVSRPEHDVKRLEHGVQFIVALVTMSAPRSSLRSLTSWATSWVPASCGERERLLTLSATSAAARRRHGHDVSFGEAHTRDGSAVRRCRWSRQDAPVPADYGMVPFSLSPRPADRGMPVDGVFQENAGYKLEVRSVVATTAQPW